MPYHRMGRRSLLAGGAGLMILAAGCAQAAPVEKTVRIWPGVMPGAGEVTVAEQVTDNAESPSQPNRSISGVTVPDLVIRHPETPNGAAILILPGGGFRNLAYDKEGTEIADWLLKLGFVTGVLKYRLPVEGWKGRMDVAIQDGQRALRLLRQETGAKTGVMGFSAGGYLAVALAARSNERFYTPADSADSLSARPDFMALVYPGFGFKSSIMPPLTEKLTRDTPPTFIVHAADDPKAPPQDSLAATAHLMTLKVPVELHMFPTGGHGFALRRTIADTWPGLFEHWAKDQVLKPA